MTICPACGAQVPEGVRFCTECGKAIEIANTNIPQVPNELVYHPVQPINQPNTEPKPVARPVQQTVPISQPIYQTPPTYVNNPDQEPPPGSKYAPMSMGSYIGHSILFSIPVIGILACLFFAFASGNVNKKNFAKATLVFFIIGLVISVLIYFAFGWMFDTLIKSVDEASGGALSDAGGVGGIMDYLNEIFKSVTGGS